MAKLRHSENKITLGSAIAMTVVCLVLGTVFLLNHTYWERPVEKDEAVQVSAVYKSYYYEDNYKSADEFELYFKDAEPLSIDPVCAGTALFKKLDGLPEGSRVDMLLLPNSDYIIEIKAEGETIMDYEYATDRMHAESIGFMILGFCMYAIGAYFIYHTIRLTRWHLKLNKSNKQS